MLFPVIASKIIGYTVPTKTTERKKIRKQLFIKIKLSFWKKEYCPYKDLLGLLIIKITNEKKVINKIVLKMYTPL
jgi:uncharacterized protein YwgA